MQQRAKIKDNSTIEVYDLSQFDIDAIMHSGQVFRYFENPLGYNLVVANNYAQIEKHANHITIKCNDANYFWNYFDLDTDYNQIKAQLTKFDKIRPAIQAGGGIRILRSDFAEMVVSFIISANNNIKRFTKTLNTLAQLYGNLLPSGLYSFPTLQQLAKLTVEDFRQLGCGYRDNYLVRAVNQLQAINVDQLSKLSNEQLAKQLCKISGVGPKVCCCIQLFAFHRLDVAPVDTHIKRAIQQLGESDADKVLSHKFAGVAQQYIFYYLQFLQRNISQQKPVN